MTEKQRHRGPHPADRHLFAPSALPALRAAVKDLSWLWTRGYGRPSAVKIVGDRYALRRRQREAVERCAASGPALRRRRQRRRGPEAVAGGTLWIDGYNVLTTVEAALAGGPLFLGRDGALRDLASVHGTFRTVAETGRALELIGGTLAEAGVAEAVWLLDRPVGNSGRLKRLLESVAAEARWPWRVELVDSPDGALARADQPVASADSAVLDRCGPWVSLARAAVVRGVSAPWLLDLGAGAPAPGG